MAGTVSAPQSLSAAPTPLTQAEATALDQAEEVIARGLDTFIEVARALAVIRDQHLYRTTYASFEDYCRKKWNYGRNYVNKLVVAAEIAGELQSALGTTVPIPSERVARALSPLRGQPAVMAAVYEEAITATDGKPTGTVVEKLVTEKLPKGRRRPLPDQYRTAVWKVDEAVERLYRLHADDRFPAHREALEKALGSEVASMSALLDDISRDLGGNITWLPMRGQGWRWLCEECRDVQAKDRP